MMCRLVITTSHARCLEANHIQTTGCTKRSLSCLGTQPGAVLARECFKAGKDYLAHVQNPRCRLAGFAYTARFEWLLDTIEEEGYSLRPEYNERKSVWNWIADEWSLFSMINFETGRLLNLVRQSVKGTYQSLSSSCRPRRRESR